MDVGTEHFFVLGNNDVIPKNRPLSEEWLHELGGFLQERPLGVREPPPRCRTPPPRARVAPAPRTGAAFDR